MTVLVTGGAGFIGSNIAARLVSDGFEVKVIDNLATGRAENIAALEDKIEFIKGSILDDKSLAKAVKDVEYMLHEAAIPSVPRSVADPLRSHEANATGTLKVLRAAKDAGVRRVVYASSSSVYGDTPTLPKREDMKPDPLSPYAVSKLCGEYYCRVFSKVYDLETVSLRYFNVFGPRQDPTSQYAAVVPKFITALSKGEAPTIFGDGEQSRDFTFVENVVDANLAALKVGKTSGEVVNVACGERTTVNELVRLLADIIGVDVSPSYMDARKGDVKHSLADISAAGELLGYKPSLGIADGLAKTCDWFLKG
ncbi:MAG: SDR family oxidoreductase [Candidatus Altiarchaeota archaeon]